MKFSMKIQGLFTDYDGTLSPVNVKREESSIAEEVGKALYRIAGRVPVGVITTKDLSFIVPRTPFARAWCATGGLEIKLPSVTVLDPRITESTINSVALAADYAKKKMGNTAFIEEKRDSRGKVLAFCVDWRQSGNNAAVGSIANKIAAFCRERELEVTEYNGQPFLDVFPCSVDKGGALEKLKNNFGILSGVLYMGDSRTDNSAFRIADVSIGVIHDETAPDLECKYWLEFRGMAEFLSRLLDSGLIFSDDLPGIKE